MKYLYVILQVIFYILLFYIIVIASINYYYYYKLSSLTIYNTNKEKYLIYVTNNIPYYYNYKNKNLKNFPITTKQYITDNQDLFINKLMKDKLLKLSINTANNSWTNKNEFTIKELDYFTNCYYLYYLFNNYAIANITGGSSGQYFYQWFTLTDYYLGLYTFIKCWTNMGWTANEKILLYYFHGSNSVKLINYLNLTNLYSLVPILDNNGDITLESAKSFVNNINNYKPELIVSFPSLIYRICQLIYENNLSLTYIPKYMDISADFLFTCQYKFIKEIFKTTDIRLSYGTIEFGQIAQQIPGKMFDYEVFDDIAYVENDDNNNLIVTNFLYTTMPIIRYNTDDKGTVITLNSSKQIITNLIGKSNSNIDYILIDNIINNINMYNLNIINFRIDETKKYIYIFLKNQENYENYFNNIFVNYKFINIYCNNNNCNTIDRFDRKNTPILKEYKM